MELPIFEVEGSRALRKPLIIEEIGALFMHSNTKSSEIWLSVDDLINLPPKLTDWLNSLIDVEAVLECEEVTAFLTKSSSVTVGASNSASENIVVNNNLINQHEQNLAIAIDRFAKGQEMVSCAKGAIPPHHQLFQVPKYSAQNAYLNIQTHSVLNNC
jgi:hypothetical protein